MFCNAYLGMLHLIFLFFSFKFTSANAEMNLYLIISILGQFDLNITIILSYIMISKFIEPEILKKDLEYRLELGTEIPRKKNSRIA